MGHSSFLQDFGFIFEPKSFTLQHLPACSWKHDSLRGLFSASTPQDFQMLSHLLTCFCFCEVEFSIWWFFGLQGCSLSHCLWAFTSCDLWRSLIIACCLSSALWRSWLAFVDLHGFLPLTQYHALCCPQINLLKPQYTCCWLIVWTVTSQISNLALIPAWRVFWLACASTSRNWASDQTWD